MNLILQNIILYNKSVNLEIKFNIGIYRNIDGHKKHQH